MDKWKDKDSVYQEEEETETYTDNYLEGDSEEESEESEERLIRKLDDELLEYFSEARVISKKSPKQKKKKEKIIHAVGQKIKANGKKGTVLYGPYELDGKQMYEVEIDGNGVISVEEKNIEKA